MKAATSSLGRDEGLAPFKVALINMVPRLFYSVVHVRVSCHHNSRDEVGPWGTSRELYANTIPSLGASFAC